MIFKKRKGAGVSETVKVLGGIFERWVLEEYRELSKLLKEEGGRGE